MKDFTDFEIISGGAERLDSVKLLWEELRDYHAEHSTHFGDQMRAVSFEFRRSRFELYAANDCLLIELIWHGPSATNVAFSASTIEIEEGLRWGCLESLYVIPGFRQQELGSLLTRRSIDWMKSQKCDRIVLSVAEGNEPVFNFYRRFGFQIRHSAMQLIEEK